MAFHFRQNSTSEFNIVLLKFMLILQFDFQVYIFLWSLYNSTLYFQEFNIVLYVIQHATFAIRLCIFHNSTFNFITCFVWISNRNPIIISHRGLRKYRNWLPSRGEMCSTPPPRRRKWNAIGTYIQLGISNIFWSKVLDKGSVWCSSLLGLVSLWSVCNISW